jgi:hypothetical protein
MGAFPLSQKGVWMTIPDATVTFTSQGGPLMISLDLWLYSPSSPQYFSCQPLVDAQWAGAYGQYPVAPLWSEGLQGPSSGWFGWQKSRVYTGVPAGDHTLTVQCMKYYEYPDDIVVGHATVPHSVSVIELH